MDGKRHEVSDHNVQLECGDRATFNPAPFLHDIVWCASCREYRVVVGGQFLSRKPSKVGREYSYRAVCRECRFNAYRIHRHNCENSAMKHSGKCGHVVDVITKAGDYVSTPSRTVTQL